MYSENAVDVFDVNNMEWIQTIPLKKVRAGGFRLRSGATCWTRSAFYYRLNRLDRMIITSPLPPQVRPLNVDGSLNLLGLETVRLIYFRNKMAGKNLPAPHWNDPRQD